MRIFPVPSVKSVFVMAAETAKVFFSPASIAAGRFSVTWQPPKWPITATQEKRARFRTAGLGRGFTERIMDSPGMMGGEEFRPLCRTAGWGGPLTGMDAFWLRFASSFRILSGFRDFGSISCKFPSQRHLRPYPASSRERGGTLSERVPDVGGKGPVQARGALVAGSRTEDLS